MDCDESGCPECGGYTFVYTVSDLVCTKCGECVARVPFRDEVVIRAYAPTYKRIFHFNERMRQWIMAEPRIPNGVFTRIKVEFHTGNYGSACALSKDLIRQLVRNAGLSTRYV